MSITPCFLPFRATEARLSPSEATTGWQTLEIPGLLPNIEHHVPAVSFYCHGDLDGKGPNRSVEKRGRRGRVFRVVSQMSRERER